MKNRILLILCGVVLSVLLVSGQWLHQAQAHQDVGIGEHKSAGQCDGSCRSVIKNDMITKLENVLPDEDPDPEHYTPLRASRLFAYLSPALVLALWYTRWRPPDIVRLWGAYRL